MAVALCVLTACGGESKTAGEPAASTTESAETTTTAETTTATTESSEETTKSSEYTTSEETTTGSDSDWDDMLPGVWRAPQPYGGEELWTFNGRTHGVTWNYWPRGVGVGNPLDNGVPAPVNIGSIYSVDGDTLTIENMVGGGRVYTDLTMLDSESFSVEFNGDTITFHRYTL
ncbi:MAG TPA: hypothetical protein VJT49_07955 [Amycolatopsis sp.]|uniref:hypothetical protein n=1 Tax=Amycolatopsis sp. TaxID=37632 RepID=UPI002B47F1C5|nr:hypothetical protein [Amycolatopsis sp.]HKS45041.1 hypothetical protein [Amycolatopsis sp.]